MMLLRIAPLRRARNWFRRFFDWGDGSFLSIVSVLLHLRFHHLVVGDDLLLVVGIRVDLSIAMITKFRWLDVAAVETLHRGWFKFAIIASNELSLIHIYIFEN